MAIPVSSIVEVNITRLTAAVAQAAFGVPLIVGEHSYFAERIKFVSSLAEITDLGFLTSDVEYKLAAAVLAQNPKPAQIALGRKSANVQGEITVSYSADFVTGNVINLTVNGEAIAAVTFDTDQATTAAALELAVEAIEGVATATVVGNDLAVLFETGVDGSVADSVVTGGASQPTSTIATTIAAVTYASELALIAEESEQWYALLIESTLQADILSAAAWVQAHSPKKIFGARSSAAGVIDSGSSTDLASVLSGKGYDRTFLVYHAVADEYLDAAILGRMLPLAPGSATFKFKTVAGVTPDALTTAQNKAATDKSANTYVAVGGVSIFTNGTMASGEYIDVIIGIDWLEARIQERVYGQLVRSPKIPFTDGGVGVIEAEISAQLQLAITQGVLAENPAPSVSVPLVADVSANDKAARTLPDVTFQGTLAGAIHKTIINGTVSI